jgi:hypothetical protein
MIQAFFQGALASAAAIAGLFFFRFWRTAGDRLFLAFALAFWLLSVQWAAVGLLGLPDETQHLLYLLRLIAFGLIVFAVLDKNRA